MKKVILFLSLLAGALNLISCGESSINDLIEEGGSSTENVDLTGYIKINSANELAKIGNDMSYPLNGKYYLTQDITLGGDWVTIGESEYTPFTGTLYGAGKTISGLSINNDSYYGEINCCGLFGYTKEAIISKLTIYNPSVTGNQDYVGALVGYAETSTISSCCVVDGHVTGENYVGGLVGYSYYSDIIACYNTSDVDGNSAGGIVGYSSSDIVACYNAATINGTNYAGGIAGEAYIKLISCFNIGEVYSDSSAGYIVGFSNSSTISCYYSGYLHHIGAIIGEVSSTTRLYMQRIVTMQT